jgi:hypothetical protein
MQLGRTWTILIVAQVALAVALLPGVVFHTWDALQTATADPGFPAREFRAAQLVMDGPADRGFSSRYGQRQEEVARRLLADPLVAVVTYATVLPGMEMTAWVEADGVPMPATPGNDALGAGTNLGHMIRFSHIGVNALDVFQVPLLTGRGFRAGDAGASTVVVNRAFVQEILGGGSALGRQVRYVGRSPEVSAKFVDLERRYEIVGVVADFPAAGLEPGQARPKIYHAAAAGTFEPVYLAIRLRGAEAGDFATRFRVLAADVDPNLRVGRVWSMDEILRREQELMQLIALGLAIVSVSVVVLSAAGIYALMSFTVSRRRKEIGIRAALGADPGRLLRSIFARAAVQLALGALAGLAAAMGAEAVMDGELMAGHGPVVLPAVALIMIAVGFLAALGPARRGLRIHPTEALREQ